MTKRILFIDMFNVTIGMNAVTNILNSNAEQIGTFLGSMNMIRMFTDKFKPSKIFCCYDGPEAGARRRGIYRDYKDRRRVKARSSVTRIYEGENEYTDYVDSNGFIRQIGKVYDFCKLLPITSVIIPYCEGDDVIAYNALEYEKMGYEVVIISGDKDYLQLISDNIKVYNWRKKKLYNRATFKEEFGIVCENYIYMKILLGDTSDRIKGIRGIGSKTINKLFPLLNERVYVDMGDFINSLKSIQFDDTFATREKNAITNILSEDNIKQMILSFRLMKLDTECLKLNHIDILNKQISEQENKKLSRFKAILEMQKNEFNRLYQGFNNEKWLTPFNLVTLN